MTISARRILCNFSSFLPSFPPSSRPRSRTTHHGLPRTSHEQSWQAPKNTKHKDRRANATGYSHTIQALRKEEVDLPWTIVQCPRASTAQSRDCERECAYQLQPLSSKRQVYSSRGDYGTSQHQPPHRHSQLQMSITGFGEHQTQKDSTNICRTSANHAG